MPKWLVQVQFHKFSLPICFSIRFSSEILWPFPPSVRCLRRAVIIIKMKELEMVNWHTRMSVRMRFYYCIFFQIVISDQLFTKTVIGYLFAKISLLQGQQSVLSLINQCKGSKSSSFRFETWSSCYEIWIWPAPIPTEILALGWCQRLNSRSHRQLPGLDETTIGRWMCCCMWIPGEYSGANTYPIVMMPEFERRIPKHQAHQCRRVSHFSWLIMDYCWFLLEILHVEHWEDLTISQSQWQADSHIINHLWFNQPSLKHQPNTVNHHKRSHMSSWWNIIEHCSTLFANY